jgi:hypothetical protein
VACIPLSLGVEEGNGVMCIACVPCPPFVLLPDPLPLVQLPNYV